MRLPELRTAPQTRCRNRSWNGDYQNIVELMGGTIDVSSEVNKGTLFRVELELRIPEGQLHEQFWEKMEYFRF